MSIWGKNDDASRRAQAAAFQSEIRNTQAELHRTTSPQRAQQLRETLTWAQRTYDEHYRDGA